MRMLLKFITAQGVKWMGRHTHTRTNARAHARTHRHPPESRYVWVRIKGMLAVALEFRRPRSRHCLLIGIEIFERGKLNFI